MRDPEITDGNKARPYSGLLNFIVFLLLLAAVCSMAFFIYMKNSGASVKNGGIGSILSFITRNDTAVQAEVKVKIGYDPKEHPVFAVQKGKLLKISKDGVKWINGKGEEEAAFVLNTAEPLIRSAGNNAFAADIGGRDIYFMSGKSVKWSDNLDNRIINADVNEKGFAAVVMELEGYKAAAQVYDPQGNWVSTAARSENYILSAVVLNDCDAIVINSVNGSGDTVRSVIEFTDMEGNRINTVEKENVLFPVLWNMSGDKIAAVGDNLILCIDGKGKKLWEAEHEIIYSSTVVQEKNIAAAVAGGDATILSNTSDIIMYDAAGKLLWKYAMKGTVSSMTSAEGTIAAAAGRIVRFISSDGGLLAEYKAGSDISNVYMLSKKEAAVIIQGSIHMVVLN